MPKCIVYLLMEICRLREKKTFLGGIDFEMEQYLESAINGYRD